MSDEETKNRTIKLKCEIFDIIRQQETLNNQINQLQNIKVQKAQELQELESLIYQKETTNTASL